MDELKKQVLEAAVMYFGAAGRGPKFVAKIEEIFAKAKTELAAKENDHG